MVIRKVFMVLRHFADRARKTCALVTVAALLFAVPVYANPETTATPEPTPPVASEAPAAPTTAAKPPATATPQELPRKSPTQENSPIDVPVDPQTEEFRRQLAEQQARLDAFMAQLDELDRELALAAEAYNAAADRLQDTNVQIEENQQDLGDARRAYTFQVDLLNSRANSIYRQGSFATIEVLIDSKSLSDFVARVKFLNTIGLADAEVARALKGRKEMVEQAAQDLIDAKKQAEALEFELKARQIEVMLRIQDRQAMLASAQGDLLALLGQEASRRQTEEALLLSQIMSGADQAGIVVSPGSPVETAFAYHGIPYLWGGETTAGFDCSGLILYVFRQHGVELPHYSGSQFLLGEKVLPASLQPGDVVFFGSPIHHVGMYIGGGYYIHAPRTGDFVKVSALAARSDYAGARRYNWVQRTTAPLGATSAMTSQAIVPRD
ncbi:MAG: C40 family peptidase [Coriobacteriia bacterium]